MILVGGFLDKDSWSAVQSIFTCAAILFGGIWTYVTFNKLRLVNKARAEIQKIEQENNLEPAINAKIKATQLDLGDSKLYVSAVITLVNVGTKKIRFRYAEWSNPPDSNAKYQAPITFSHFLKFDEHEREIYDDHIKAAPLREDDLSTAVSQETIRAQGTVAYSVVVEVQNTGLYRISFATYIYSEDTDLPIERKPLYGYSDFFVVREVPLARA